MLLLTVLGLSSLLHRSNILIVIIGSHDPRLPNVVLDHQHPISESSKILLHGTVPAKRNFCTSPYILLQDIGSSTIKFRLQTTVKISLPNL